MTGASYNALSQPKEFTFGNGASTTWIYYGEAGPPSPNNPSYRLWQMRTVKGSTEHQKLQYVYDNVGNVLNIVDYKVTGGTQTQTFIYDHLDRLLTADADGGSTGQGQYNEGYAYNSIGNMTSKGGVTYEYEDADHKHAVSSTTIGATVQGSFSYDPAGNMTSRKLTSAGPTYSQTWDYENRLASVTVNGQTTTFTYDGNGALVKKVAPGSVTYYVGSHYEVQIDAPAAPSGLGATALSASQIRLTWTDNSDNETRFRIERSATGTSGWSQVGTVAANVTTYTNSNLACGTRYYYRVRAYNVAGTSAYSNVANAQTLACSSIPAAPSNLSAVVELGYRVGLSWTDNSDNEEGFEITSCFRASCSEIQVAQPNQTTYTDIRCGYGLAAEAAQDGENYEPLVVTAIPPPYTYCVRAYNQMGESACSNTVGVWVFCPWLPSSHEMDLAENLQAMDGTSSPDGGPQMATGDSTASASATEEGVDTTSPDTVLAEDAIVVLDEGEMVILSSAGQTERSYYYFGGQRVAMREAGVVYWLLTDHLGSTALTLNSSGSKVGELRYKAYGETRYTWGTTPTDYRFTGQRQTESLGLYHMGARWYDPYLGRFLSPDSIIPDFTNPQSLNRYMYCLGNPLALVDPSGHSSVPPWIEWILQEMRAGAQGYIERRVSINPGSEPTPKPINADIAQVLSTGAAVCDSLALAISGSGALTELALGMAGSVDPLPVEELGGAAVYYGFFNPVENRISLAGTALTAGADIFAGQTVISTQSIQFGQDTVVSGAALVLGNLFPLEGFTDSLVNALLLGYDAQRTGGNFPTYVELVCDTYGCQWIVYLNQDTQEELLESDEVEEH